MKSSKTTNGPGDQDAKQQVSGQLGDTAQQPVWTDGLRQLYDSVVDEPLPDSLKDLLSKLDDSH